MPHLHDPTPGEERMPSNDETRAPDLGYRADVDGLRAVAVVCVLLYHFGVPGFGGGFVGVDIFFVISGFLITRIILAERATGRFSFGRFYWRRARRLMPALFATLLFSLLAGAILLPPSAMASLGRSAAAAAFSVSNILFWTEGGYFDIATKLKPLLHTWSLGVEEQFYLVWPALVLALRRLVRPWAVILALGVGFGGSLWASQAMLGVDSRAAFYLTPFRLYEFGIGAAGIWLARFPVKNRAEHVLLLVLGFGLIASSVVGFDGTTPFPGLAALLPCLGSLIVIQAGSSGHRSGVLDCAPLVGLGRISYSVYLVHWPLLLFFRQVSTEAPGAATTLLLIGASIGMGALSYRFVEQPFRARQKNGASSTSRSLGAGLVAVALLISLGGIHAAKTGGWTWRLDRGQRALFDGLVADSNCRPARSSAPHMKCEFGSSSAEPPRLLLLGDSHANAYLPGIHRLLVDERIKGLHGGVLGCAPLFGASTVANDGSGSWGMCRQVSANIFRYAAKSQAEVIVLAGRWAAYTEAVPPPETGVSGTRHWLVKSGSDELSPDRSKAVFSETLEDSVRRLVRRGKKVVLLGQAPPLGNDVGHCLLRPFVRITPESIANCREFTAVRARQRLSHTDREIERVAQALPGRVLAIVPSRKMCDGDYCDVLVDGQMLYTDDDHLSAVGSRYVISLFEDEFRAFLEP